MHGCKTVAFPNISTGIYSYPKAAAAQVSISTVKTFIEANPKLEEIIFICFDKENFKLYEALLKS